MNRLLTMAAAVAMLVLTLSCHALADGPTVEVEKGAPGSGIVKITHYYSQTGVRPPFGKVETSQEILFEDGKLERRYFQEDGKGLRQVRVSQKSGAYTDTRYRPDGKTVWTRTEGGQFPTIVRQIAYYNGKGDHVLDRTYHKNGQMTVDVYAKDGTRYHQRWLSGVAGYTLVSVEEIKKHSSSGRKFVITGKTFEVHYFHPDGSTKLVRYCTANGDVVKEDIYDKANKTVRTVKPAQPTKESMLPAEFLQEVGGDDDPSAPVKRDLR